MPVQVHDFECKFNTFVRNVGFWCVFTFVKIGDTCQLTHQLTGDTGAFGD